MENFRMIPVPGDRCLRHVGDHIRFTLCGASGAQLHNASRAMLRTNLGRAAAVRREIVDSHAGNLPIAGASWRDIPMRESGGEWHIDLALTEVGYFQAKAYAVDEQGKQHWPDGPDVGISVHPDRYRSGNTIYCAFARMFGEGKSRSATEPSQSEAQVREFERLGCAVIPPSGKLRDVRRELPHIFDSLNCRIIHLLPVNPVPTTYARFGRMGSPYASLDLTAIDPALVEFDRRTTGVDQFCELTFDVHSRGGRLFLDIVTNHTGWGSILQNTHPEWFLRNEHGDFVSPGAWGVTWEDLVELDHRSSAPWDHLAEVFLTWCKRGVDGFRCDAGYMVPMQAWRYITARVRQQFPDTLFLLEGLGGPWETTESLLTDGGMQWAYSELFQNYTGAQVSRYLDYGLRQSGRVGTYVHYSETHDNDRMAKKGRLWSLLRNRLCGLASVNGAFGFTCGVEWLAREKVDVHGSSPLSWGQAENLVPELAAINKLLGEHPCFFDGAQLARLSPPDSPVFALRRDSSEGADHVLVLANLDATNTQGLELPGDVFQELGQLDKDLLGQAPPKAKRVQSDKLRFELAPGACYCLAPYLKPKGLSGAAYRRARAAAAWAIKALRHAAAEEEIGFVPWRELADWVDSKPASFLATLSQLKHSPARNDLITRLREIEAGDPFQPVVIWRMPDVRRITTIPPDHWLLLLDSVPFRARLETAGNGGSEYSESIQVRDGHIAHFAPRAREEDAKIQLERFGNVTPRVEADVRFLAPVPEVSVPSRDQNHPEMTLLTNGIGGMARLCVHFGRIRSKYDCLLGANLHDKVPVDRHVFVKRARVWVVADGFVTPLDEHGLIAFEDGPPAEWRFVVNAGDGRTVEVRLEADMLEGSNTTVLRFTRPKTAPALGKDLPSARDVRLTVRLDIEDRNFHWETIRNPSADDHFRTHCQPLKDAAGFQFTPAVDRQLRAFADKGSYHHEEEWCDHIPHPNEQSRGQTSHGDAYSPGWFDLPLPKGETVHLTVTAETQDPAKDIIETFGESRRNAVRNACAQADLPETDTFGHRLLTATRAFVVRRDTAKTVIAGYPWFLDWGRDSLICARGLLAAGMHKEVKQLLETFGRFEENGTLPNSIHGEDASNRDTSDAPLWYGVVCEELSALANESIPDIVVDPRGRSIADILRNIATGYMQGTPNGIRMDPKSGLIWSPKHFTWMDTNFPAATPRAGYPIEIQVLWVRLLRQLQRIGVKHSGESWKTLATRAEASIHERFWIEEVGYFSDLLIAPDGRTADQAVVDHALRSNQLFAVSLGVVSGIKARQCVSATLRHLVLPGALRSLAPLPTAPPLPVIGNNGQLLNDPSNPYWGQYAGDEDTRRKPAYHNGTAWTWTFPSFCEALVRAWDFQPIALQTAKAYLGSMNRLLVEGCAGQIPEILDGDAPHQQRGCDAQAWGATEALRVWKWLNQKPGPESQSKSDE